MGCFSIIGSGAVSVALGNWNKDSKIFQSMWIRLFLDAIRNFSSIRPERVIIGHVEDHTAPSCSTEDSAPALPFIRKARPPLTGPSSCWAAGSADCLQTPFPRTALVRKNDRSQPGFRRLSPSRPFSSRQQFPRLFCQCLQSQGRGAHIEAGLFPCRAGFWDSDGAFP